MTPSVQDYQAAQKNVQAIRDHGRYLQTQTKDPKTFAANEADFQAAAKKMRDIKARLPKGTK
jgi:hypothetical protein